MSISRELAKRCESKCELCASETNLSTYAVDPKDGSQLENQIAVCQVCLSQLTDVELVEEHHWRCLNDAMWSQVPAVQVVVYRMLHQLKSTTEWSDDLIDMMYLEDDTKSWAMEGIIDMEDQIVHLDSNGHVLQAGDNVVLIQDLNVKGSSIVAKRGVAVRRIRLDPDNAEYIEGKVDGQHIVILTKYVKKTN